jgi:hypothetical protein
MANHPAIYPPIPFKQTTIDAMTDKGEKARAEATMASKCKRTSPR